VGAEVDCWPGAAIQQAACRLLEYRTSERETAFRNFRRTQHWRDWSCRSAGKSLYPSNVTLELQDELRMNHGLHPALVARFKSGELERMRGLTNCVARFEFNRGENWRNYSGATNEKQSILFVNDGRTVSGLMDSNYFAARSLPCPCCYSPLPGASIQ
jgi:hypothetical protein